MALAHIERNAGTLLQPTCIFQHGGVSECVMCAIISSLLLGFKIQDQ